MLARPTAHRGSMNRPIEPRQHRDLLQEGQTPVRAGGIALGQVFVELGLGFRLSNVRRTGNAREHF